MIAPAAQPDPFMVPIVYRTGGAQRQVGLVDVGSDTVQPVLPHQRSQLSSNALVWAWGIFVGDPPLPSDHLVYTVHDLMLDRKEWSRKKQHDFVDAMISVWQWTSSAGSPVLCSYARHERELDEAVTCWREVMLPFAAQIIQGLYCPDGIWEQCDRWWVGAAAKLARAWLAFYEHADAPTDRRHTANRLLLWRIYMLALLRLADLRETWSDDQAEELERAMQQWTTICISDQYAWLFQRTGKVWWGDDSIDVRLQTGLEYREWRREAEVQRVVASVRQLLQSPGIDIEHHSALRYQLDLVMLTWYLPRYDITMARQIRAATGSVRHQHGQSLMKRVSCWIQLAWSWMTFGSVRLYGGIVVGFIATALQGDTWNGLAGLAQSPWRGVGLVVILISITIGYLYDGIRRKIHQTDRVWQRTWALWIRGQIFAIALGVMVTWMLAPLLMDATFLGGVTFWTAMGMVFIYAQLALFIGFFAQLFFDEKPVTTLPDTP